LNQAHPTTNTPVTSENIFKRQASAAAIEAADPSLSFWRAWPWWLVPALAGLILVLYFVDPFIGDWDGMDYTILSLAGYPSSMALGRNLFIFGKSCSLRSGPRAVQRPAGTRLSDFQIRRRGPGAARGDCLLGAGPRLFENPFTLPRWPRLFLAFSPVFVLYGGQVMTDVPSVLLLCVALVVHYRGVRQERVWLVFAGAALLGLGVNLRETMGFYAPW